MGIFINLNVIPGRIDPNDWMAVYKESLKLIEAFPFLSRVRGEDGYLYAKRTESTENLTDGYTGWCTDGDMRDGANTERYQLIEDIGYYRKQVSDLDNGYDILLDRLYDLDIKHPQCSLNIWGGKTQGERSHIYLLAIACLICYRFPNAAFVDGDISAGQCCRAVVWANQFLDTPIDMPVTADTNGLLSRLKAAGLTEMQCLKAFFKLTLASKDGEMGACLKENFSPQALTDYYRDKLKPLYHREGQLYLDGKTLKEYLTIGLDFHSLCRMVMTDLDGNRLTPAEFMEELLRRKLHVQEKESFDYTLSARERALGDRADSINGMLGQLFLMMNGGQNRYVDAYIPLETICEAFQDVLGKDCDADRLADGILQKGIEPNDKSAQSILYDAPDSLLHRSMEKTQKTDEEAVTYDIASLEDLMEFRQLEDGSYTTVSPSLDEYLAKSVKTMRGFADKIWKEFSVLDHTGRELWFQIHYDELITEELHQKMLRNMMDDMFIRKYVAIYLVSCDTNSLSRFVHGMLWNEVLLNYYWKK